MVCVGFPNAEMNRTKSARQQPNYAHSGPQHPPIEICGNWLISFLDFWLHWCTKSDNISREIGTVISEKLWNWEPCNVQRNWMPDESSLHRRDVPQQILADYKVGKLITGTSGRVSRNWPTRRVVLFVVIRSRSEHELCIQNWTADRS